MSKNKPVTVPAAPLPSAEITLPKPEIKISGVVMEKPEEQLFDLDAFEVSVIEYCKRRIEYICKMQELPEWKLLTHTQRSQLLGAAQALVELSGEPAPKAHKLFGSLQEMLGNQVPAGLIGRLADPSALANRRRRSNHPLGRLAVGGVPVDSTTLTGRAERELPDIMASV